MWVRLHTYAKVANRKCPDLPVLNHGWTSDCAMSKIERSGRQMGPQGCLERMRITACASAGRLHG